MAAFLSAIVPGAGQLLLAQRRKGLVLMGIFVIVLLGFWPVRLPRYYAGLLLLLLGWAFLYLYSACSALLSRSSTTTARASRWWLAAVVPIALVVAEILGASLSRAAGFRAFGVPSTSMEKTISRGDHVVVDTHRYRGRDPGRGDVVVLLRNGTFFVKRIVALGGDTIQGRGGAILLNGQLLTEAYAQHNGNPPPYLNTFGPVTVPPGKYFVIGDNRDVSLDSRSPEFGFLESKSILGKTLYIVGSDRVGQRIQ